MVSRTKKSQTNARSKKQFSLKMVSPLEPGIVCADITRMVEFYSRVLGLTIASDTEATAEMSAIFGAAPHGFRIIRLQTPYGERVKLVQVKKGRGKRIQAPKWVFNRQGIAYITFIVSNINEVRARLSKHGVKLIRPLPVAVREGFVALFAEDPEGNFIEFVEYEDIASYRQDILKRENRPIEIGT